MNQDRVAGAISQPISPLPLPSELPTSKTSTPTAGRRGKPSKAVSLATAKDNTPSIRLNLTPQDSPHRKRKACDPIKAPEDRDDSKELPRSSSEPALHTILNSPEAESPCDETFLSATEDETSQSAENTLILAPTRSFEMSASLTDHGLEDTPSNRVLIQLLNKLDTISSDSALERTELKGWRDKISVSVSDLQQL